MSYHVLDNNEPAVLEKHALYYNNIFDDFEAAQEYLKNWLGGVWELPKNYRGEKFDYSGEGDIVEIVQKRR